MTRPPLEQASAMDSQAPQARRSLRSRFCWLSGLFCWLFSSLTSLCLLALFLVQDIRHHNQEIDRSIASEIANLQDIEARLNFQQLNRHLKSLGLRLELNNLHLEALDYTTDLDQALPNIQLKRASFTPFSYQKRYRFDQRRDLVIQASWAKNFYEYLRYALVAILASGMFSLIFAAIIYVYVGEHISLPISLLRKQLKNLDQDTELSSESLAVSLSQDFGEFQTAVIETHGHFAALRKDQNDEHKRYQQLALHVPHAVWCAKMATPIDASVLNPAELSKRIAFEAELIELNDAAESLLPAKYLKTLAQEGYPLSWKALPFLSEGLFQQLVEQELVLREQVVGYNDSQGKKRYLNITIIATEVNARLTFLWGLASDASEQIQILRTLEQREEELNLNKFRLSQAQALAHMGHWSYDSKLDDLQISEEFARIYGFNPIYDTPTWRDLIQRIHPEDRLEIINILSDPRSEAIGAEHRIIWPNGEERFVQAVASKTIVNNLVTKSFGILMDITGRRKAEYDRRKSEKALIESEAKMAEAQAIAHMGHWVLDYEERKFTCSDEFFRLHGYDPQSFSPHVRDFTSLIHPADKKRMREKLNSARSSAFNEDFRIIRKDGELRYMRATVTPYYSGGKNTSRIFGISMDVTEQKLAELELKNSQEQLSKVFQSSPDGIFVIEKQSQIFVDSNQAFQDMAGLSQQQLAKSTLQSCGLWLDQAQAKHLASQLHAETSGSNLEVKFKTNKGGEQVALVSWRPIDIDDQACVLVIVRDITQLKNLEAMASRQQLKLLQAEKLASLGTMVAGVAHEINNPNHLIQMNSELLQDFAASLLPMLEESLDEDFKAQTINGLPLNEIVDSFPELLVDIRQSTKRIDRIVKDLKDFARPQENSEVLRCDLNKIILKTQHSVASDLEKHQQQLKLELAGDLPPVFADALRIEQVLVNLIVNACQASFEKGSTIEICSYANTIRNKVVCEVKDQGCGIRSDRLHKIFDPFFTTKQNSGGTGLGLAISYSIIQEHGGQLEALSRSNGGTCMRFSLPIAQDSSGEEASPSS